MSKPAICQSPVSQSLTAKPNSSRSHQYNLIALRIYIFKLQVWESKDVIISHSINVLLDQLNHSETCRHNFFLYSSMLTIKSMHKKKLNLYSCAIKLHTCSQRAPSLPNANLPSPRVTTAVPTCNIINQWSSVTG